MTENSKTDNLLHVSWSDSMWYPHLNASNIMDYFAERSNPFYSRDCNNEFIKMQQNTRIDQLTHMQGIEYMLLHTQEPILYIIRKQHRYSPTQVTPLANYHIIGGQIFQTPDLGSVINSRLLSTVNHLYSAFVDMQSYSQYHPSKGYWWHFRNQPEAQQQQKKEKEKKAQAGKKEEPASPFQRRRVNFLLEELSNKFPYKAPATQEKPAAGEEAKPETRVDIKQEKVDMKQEKVDIKQEKVENPPTPQGASSQRTTKPPPEKRMRVGP
ncbi:mediator complex subunit 6 [Oratosquilla oratoria]|uniref:mediator complex subunit 6 n=1 Tax=Oratosquilla oratoria TaxID=337810 RepID=UPI003F771A14